MRGIRLLVALIIALALPATVLAADINNTGNITLAKGDNRTGNYYVTGQTVTINGDVTGDVVCAGQTVVINGSVGGDVICGAQTLTINGAVGGSIRGAGQALSVNGTVGRNVTLAAQAFVLGSAARVGGDLVAASQTALIGAPVGQDLYVAAQDLQINASVGGNVTAYVGTLKVAGTAAIAGNLDYTSSLSYSVDKANVAGKISHHTPAQGDNVRYSASDIFAMLVYWIAAALMGILIAIWLFPRFVRSVTTAMMTRWQASILWGVVVLLGGPIVLLILALTVVGLPVAIVLGVLWLLAILSSGLFAGVAIGRLTWQREDGNRRALYLSALVGVPLILLISWIPIVGELVATAAVVWTLGGIIQAINRARILG